MEKLVYEFEYLFNQYDVNKIGLKDIIQLIDKTSLDEVVGKNLSEPFSSNATTFLYSGGLGTDTVTTMELANVFNNGRTIDKTVAAKLLNDDNFDILLKNAVRNDIKNASFDISLVEGAFTGDRIVNLETLKRLLSKPNLTDLKLDRATNLASTGFKFEPTKGAWAIVSENFVKATPPTSKIECIVPNANTGRTWGQVEIPTALEHLPDSQVIGNTTVGELKALRDTKGMDSDGRVIGAGNKAKEYYDNGDYENAVRVVVDGVVTNIEGWVIMTRVA